DLWLGLDRADPGQPALLRLLSERSSAVGYSPANSRIPSGPVSALAAVGDTLWIASATGPVGFDMASGLWYEPPWAAEVEGDSVVLVPASDGASQAKDDMYVRLAALLDLGSMGRSLVTTLKSLEASPPYAYQDWGSGVFTLTEFLAQPALLPFL